MGSKNQNTHLYRELKKGYKAMYHLNLGIAEENFLVEREVEIKYTSQINNILTTKNEGKDGE